MPEIAAAQTAADMTYAKPHAFMPTGGSNRRAARMQAAALRWLVRMAALLTAAVLVFLIGYILVMGIPNLKPELFAWEYNSENVSLTPALINTVLMTAFSLAISTPLGIFAAIWLVEYAHRGSKLVKVVRVTTETLQGIPSIVYGLFGMLFFVTKLHWGYSMIAGAFTLAIMVLPVIMRTTEEALIAVPDSYREGSFGLGAGKLRTVFRIVLPSAVPGIFSGIILAIGRIVGETAALIFTAGTFSGVAGGVMESGRTLAVHMYCLLNEGLHRSEAYATAVVLLVMVIGINALSGPLHGGANEAVLRQLKAIRDSGKTVKEFVEDAKANGHRISGLGHRVYKSYDPRAAIAKTYLQKIMERADTLKLPADERALFDVATELEQIALSDDYFVSRHLYPNVDFYTGLIYRAIGFDPSMFTTLFALGRIPGWIAQYREMLADPNTKIGRPRQVYTGYTERDYVPMDQRH